LSVATQSYPKILDGHPRNCPSATALWVSARTGSLATVATYTTTRDTTARRVLALKVDTSYDRIGALADCLLNAAETLCNRST
jgi:hypothetical protein